MKRKIFSILLLVSILCTGCLKKDNLEGVEIVTTSYPYEYIANYLYGEHALVTSIYPDGTDIKNYELSEKVINDYSKKELFIYSGLSSNKDLALELLERNKNLMIIDATSGMETIYGEEELWLNPSNLLMISQNIKNGLNQYIKNNYLKKEIDDAYHNIKIELSALDAEIRLTAQNATRTTIIVGSDSLLFLEKYGFNVISLDNRKKTVTDKAISDVKALIQKGEVKHIFLLDHDKTNDIIKKLIADTKVATYTYKRLDNMTDMERNNGENYMTLMKSNIDLLKSELY